eukprot:6461322-Amphidinium_carterae.2
MHVEFNMGNTAKGQAEDFCRLESHMQEQGESPQEISLLRSNLQVSSGVHDSGNFGQPVEGGTEQAEKSEQRQSGETKKKKHPSSQLKRLKVVSVNARSLLCDKNPDLVETARSQLFRREMIEREVHIAFVQETKTEAKWVRDCEDFEAIAASPHAPHPQARVGGLLTLVAKVQGLKVLWAREFSYRVLAVGVLWNSERWLLLNAYAPTSAASFDEFDAFWNTVLEVFGLARKNGLAILAGSDLNTRLGSEVNDLNIGEVVFDSEAGELRRRAELVARGLAQFNMAAWSTFRGTPTPTWCSPHDKESQIDYILGDVNKLGRMVDFEVCDVKYFQSDHKLLQCVVLSDFQPEKKQKSLLPKARKVRGPDHSLAIKLALATRDHSDWLTIAEPVAAMQACCSMVRDVVKNAPGSKATPSKAWIGEASWQQIREGAVLRRTMNKTWKWTRKAHLRWTWQIWSASSDEWSCVQEQAVWNTQCERRVQSLVWCLFRIAARAKAKKVQCAVKADKLAWLDAKTNQLAEIAYEGTSSDLHRQVKRCLTKITPNLAATSRGALTDAAGRTFTTEDEKEMLWQGHWATLYGGRILSEQKSFSDYTIRGGNKDDNVDLEEDDLFTEAEVMAAMTRQCNGKASVDCMPTKELAVLKQKMTPVWTQAFNEFMRRGEVPDAFKGTLLFVVPKKVATACTADFRGLQLMVWSAKIFARALFMKCMQKVHIATGQFGLGPNAGVDYPHLILTQLREYAQIHRIRLAWLFVDVRTAFDRIIRQVMFRPGHEMTLEMLLQMGIQREVACGVLTEVADNKPVLWDHDFSPAMRRMLASLLQGTWLTLPQSHGGTQLETRLGTPQGNSLSGLIYILYQQRVLTSITQFIAEQDMALVLKGVADNTYSTRGEEGEPVVMPVLAYHDDALVMVRGEDVNLLPENVRRVVRFATSSYQGHNLMLNWSKLKSELMMILPRDESERFHASVNAAAAAKQWSHPSLEVDNVLVRIVRTYPYLGKKLQDTGGTQLHAKDRCALAAASVRTFGRVYSSSVVPQRVKTDLCSGMYTLPQLTYASNSQRELDKATMQTYASAYLLSWKACLGKRIIRDGEFQHLSSDWILHTVGRPSWRVHLDSLVLRLAIRVIKSNCAVFRAAMGSVGLTAGSWWTHLAGAINRMKQRVREAAILPDFSENSRPVWMQVIALDPPQWKRWIKRYVAEDVKARSVNVEAGQYQVREAQVKRIVEDTDYQCHICQKSFGTYRGLLSHRRQAHQADSSLARRVSTNVCAACHGEYTSRTAHLSHLTNNLRCAMYTLMYCEELSDAELKVARAIKGVLRTAPPRRGPKQVQELGGMPISQSIELLELSLSDDLAAT